MFRLLPLSLLIAACLVAGDPTQAVREAAEGWHTAAVKQDAATLNRLLADDLTYIHSGGKLENKSEYMSGVLKGPSHYESFTYSDVKIKLYGNTAVLTGFTDVKAVNRPVYRVRTLHVYVNNGGQWQLLAHESTRISQ
jgi:ketosteroid isomerase-like protein